MTVRLASPQVFLTFMLSFLSYLPLKFLYIIRIALFDMQSPLPTNNTDTTTFLAASHPCAHLRGLVLIPLC